jgi:hypothetical protein
MPIDYKEYPENWKTEIRPAVLARANNCCEECGVKNHALIHRHGKGQNDWVYWPEGMESEAWSLDGKKATKIILTIAHLDHDKLNHDVSLERLKALCQKCHLRYDIKHHTNNRKYGRDHKKNNLEIDFNN